MDNKFTDEILNEYKLGKITLEETFEYGKGYIKIDGIEIAEFNRLEINIRPIIRKVPLVNAAGEDKVVIGYEPIYARLNISKKYSRYNEIKSYSQLQIEVIDGIFISECNIKNIEDDNNIILQNISIENIAID